MCSGLLRLESLRGAGPLDKVFHRCAQRAPEGVPFRLGVDVGSVMVSASCYGWLAADAHPSRGAADARCDAQGFWRVRLRMSLVKALTGTVSREGGCPSSQSLAVMLRGTAVGMDGGGWVCGTPEGVPFRLGWLWVWWWFRHPARVGSQPMPSLGAVQRTRGATRGLAGLFADVPR